MIGKNKNLKPIEFATFLRQLRYDPIEMGKFYIWVAKNFKKIIKNRE